MRPLKFSSASSRSTELAAKAGEESVTQARLRGMGLDLAADRLRPGSPLAKIAIHLAAVPQVIGDDRVDVIEPENREVLRDLFR